ncbi:Methyl-accepting chemotaxis protein 3 [Jannaschia seosinensis]|uniref:Methyl-accepting chemotaxis protein 3 n=1 Tax=Jannaschia seosinensis TaxID=313367 RepID=A0A0M7BFC5_9RHOB|nr:methyl-accepting chemotaxis protein [Jannaschia seosinensis]CUH40788.1 Methyl-accepting chemotaxis protein 3 [Jannaschia seosinensis]
MNQSLRVIAAEPNGPSLSEEITPLGYLITDLAAFVDGIGKTAQANLDQIDRLRDVRERLSSAIATLRDGFEGLSRTAGDTSTSAKARLAAIEANSLRWRKISEWGTGIAPRMRELDESLRSVVESNAEITQIARQVNILAVNASIEAARAGEAGRGFAVVAEAIKELSRKTASAAQGIEASIGSLEKSTRSIREESEAISPQFAESIQSVAGTVQAVSNIAADMAAAREQIEAMDGTVAELGFSEDDVQSVCDGIETGARHAATEVAEAHERSAVMMNRCERLLQRAAEVEVDGPDRKFIEHAARVAKQVEDALTDAVLSGRISTAALFDIGHIPIPGTNPAQHEARHLAVTDRVVPPIIEAALTFDERVIFCAPCDRIGYIATHNKKFSRPQGPDPAWNAAHSRNRRIFTDRTGKKAGANRSPFLMQLYRRDMGEQGMVMMKDISVPIIIQGRHWGGLRLGYRNDTAT